MIADSATTVAERPDKMIIVPETVETQSLITKETGMVADPTIRKAQKIDLIIERDM
jgi:hypothetical protein